MARLTFQQFNGELPKVADHLLADGYATQATNARLTSGTLRPMRASTQAHLFSSAKSRFVLHGSTWLGFDHDVDAAPGPVAEDRLYVTHENAAPQIYLAGSWYPLALSAPTVAPTATVTVGTPDAELAEETMYCHTWVTSAGEESAPSPLSSSVMFSSGVTVTLSGMTGVTNVDGRPVTKKRIYRSTTSTSGVTDLYLIAEIAASATAFVDVHGENPDQEAIPSRDYDPPVSDLRGITALPNGMMAAFSGKDLYFCEPYITHAWPDAYALTMSEYIVGLCALGTSVAVMTSGAPYIVQGLTPDAMTQQRVEGAWPCLSKASIVDMGYAAIYASPVGLVQITESGSSIVSKSIWDKADWEAMNPYSVDAGRVGDAYVFSYLPAGETVRRLAIVNLSGEQPVLVASDVAATGFWNDPKTNALYHLDATGKKVMKFDAGADLSYAWKSKPTRFPIPMSMGAVLVETIPEVGKAFSMTVYADGEPKRVITAAGAVERLPDGEHREWSIGLTGTAEILRVSIGQTIEEAEG